MLKLERLRFINIGAPDCRMHDLSISTVDERGEPVDTVLWLRNGGGKTAILGLFFAHLLPDAREFLKGKKDNAKFTDHVLEGDTSYILASWAGEPASLNLLDDARPRLVTGRVVERRAGLPGGSLPGFMFTFRPVPGVLDVDTVPWQLGGRRLTLSAFEAEMHRLGRDHREIEFTLTERQSQWAAHLQAVGLDPQVFRYQRQMNAGEAEAAAGFMQFRTSDDFVDFLLGVVTPAEHLETLEEQIRKYAEKLSRLPEWQREQELIERALPLLGRHAGHLRQKEDLERERTETEEAAARLGQQLAAGVSESTALVKQAEEELARLEADGQRVRARREDIQARMREVEYRQAGLAEVSAESQLRVAEATLDQTRQELEAWHLSEPLARQHQLLARRAHLTRLLEVNRQDAAPILRELEQTGSALRAARLAAAATAQAAADQTEDEAGALRLAAEACARAAERLRQEAADLRRRVETARQALGNLNRSRGSLRTDGDLRPGEAAEAAAARWAQEQDRSRERLGEAEATLAALADEAAELREREVFWSAQVAAKGRDIAELGRRLVDIERACRTLWSHPAVRSVVDVDEPDLWRQGAAIDQALQLRWLDTVDEQMTLRIRTEEDRRTSAGVEARGTLPPSLDTQEGLDILRAAGIHSAYLGWDYLRSVQDPAVARALLLAAPELAGGIVLNDPAQLEPARQALDMAGFQPVTLIAVGLAEGFRDGEAVPHAFLVPPKPGLYDPAAAEAERARAEARLQQAEGRRAALQSEAESAVRARELLASFLREWAPGEPARLAKAIAVRQAEVADLERHQARAQARTDEIRHQREGLQQERDALNRLLGRVPGLLARLRDLASAEQEEPGWSDLVATGSAAAAALDERADQEVARRDEHLLERDRRLRAAQQQRGEAQSLTRAAAGLPEVDCPDGLRQLPLQELSERHGNLQSAYAQRLGSDVIGAELSRLADDLAKLEPTVRAAPEDVRRRAEELLASPAGQADQLRVLAVSAAKERHEKAVADAALADRTLADRKRARAEAERMRSQPPRLDVDVDSPAAAAEMLRGLAEADRAAGSEENSINAQHGVVGPRIASGRARAARLRSALRLVGTAVDEGVEALTADAASFAGSEDEADRAAADVTTHARQLVRQLEGARSQVTESGGELRKLAEHEVYRQKMPVITLRLAEPGAGSQAVQEFAAEMERRLPGLRADIETAQSDRRMVLIGLTQAARDGFRDLRRLEDASRLPQGLDAWSGVPFVQINVDPPRTADEWEARLGAVLQVWVDRQEIPAHSGIAILRQAVRAANGRGAAAAAGEGTAVRSSFRVTLLKPDAVLTTQRYAVEAMKFSEGQDLTTAILLYCTFINLRVNRSGDRGGAAGALFLDNPIGKASLDKLIELQRRVAEIMKVQIIATTGVKDREAISHYPKIVGLRPVRTRDARMKYVQPSDDPMDLGSLDAAELIVKPAP